MTDWTDLNDKFGYESKVYSTELQQLRDNITALAEDATGAPDIDGSAIEDDSLTASKLNGLTASITEINNGCTGIGVSKPKWKAVAIYSWNMNNDSTFNVTHDITGTILAVYGVVWNDANTTSYVIPDLGNEWMDLRIDQINSSTINLTRKTGGSFDNSNFDSTGVNRGYLIIAYID